MFQPTSMDDWCQNWVSSPCRAKTWTLDTGMYGSQSDQFQRNLMKLPKNVLARFDCSMMQGYPSDPKHGDDTYNETGNLDDDDDYSFKIIYLGCARCACGEGRTIFNGRGESGE